MRFVHYHNRDHWVQQTAVHMATSLESALRKENCAVMIAAGGSTPQPIYAALASMHLDWGKITIIPSDERWVEESSRRSNMAMLKESFAAPSCAKVNFQSLYRQGYTPDSAAPIVTKALTKFSPANLCVLGMGEDMHTASLFPHMPELRSAMADDAAIAMPAVMPETSERRITFSLPWLKKSNRIVLLINGVNKRHALRAALASVDKYSSPVSPLLECAHIHYVD